MRPSPRTFVLQSKSAWTSALLEISSLRGPEFRHEVQPPASLKGLDIPSRRAVFVPWKPSKRRAGLAMTVAIRQRVGACMWKLKQTGYAREVPIAGELKGWWIPTRDATPSTALVPQEKAGFPIP